MWKYAIFISLCNLAYADVPATPLPVEQLIADGDQSPDLYDKPYNLNPVPIDPRTPEPTTWKDAYNRLCASIQNIEARLDMLQSRVRTLEDQTDVTDEDDDGDDDSGG